MTQRQPQASVLLEIPDCRMEASVTHDREIMFQLGWPHDTAILVFKHDQALRRFVHLATDILSSPTPEPSAVGTEIVSSPG